MELGVHCQSFLQRLFMDPSILKVGLSLKPDLAGLGVTYPTVPCFANATAASPRLEMQVFPLFESLNFSLLHLLVMFRLVL